MGYSPTKFFECSQVPIRNSCTSSFQKTDALGVSERPLVDIRDWLDPHWTAIHDPNAGNKGQRDIATVLLFYWKPDITRLLGHHMERRRRHDMAAIRRPDD